MPEGRLVIKELLTVSIEGLGPNHQTSIFPCSIFQVMSGVNKEKGTPNYDLFRLALKSTSLRLYPNYMCCNWSIDLKGNELDKKVKQEYLDSLTTEEMARLVKWCENNYELSQELGLEVVDE